MRYNKRSLNRNIGDDMFSQALYTIKGETYCVISKQDWEIFLWKSYQLENIKPFPYFLIWFYHTLKYSVLEYIEFIKLSSLHSPADSIDKHKFNSINTKIEERECSFHIIRLSVWYFHIIIIGPFFDISEMLQLQITGCKSACVTLVVIVNVIETTVLLIKNKKIEDCNFLV